VEVTIFSANISFRCIPISTSLAAVRDEIHFSRRSPWSKTGNGFGGNGSDLVFCSSRKNATLDKFRNKRKVGCRLLHGENCRRDGETARARKGGNEREERRGCRGRPRPYRERVEPRKNHKSNDLPVTRTWRPIRRRSMKTMKHVMLVRISDDFGWLIDGMISFIRR